MMYVLANNFIQVKVSSLGAELKSLIFKSDLKERMWTGDPVFWNKTSPLLFPIVGSLKHNEYKFKDKVYHLNRHGFAREMEFELVENNSTRLIFRLNSSEETKNFYPFDFNLYVEYELNDEVLNCNYEVINRGNDEMLFSIGAHPAFVVGNGTEASYNEYALHFNKDNKINCYKIYNGLIGEDYKEMVLKDNQLSLSYDLFYDDALVFKSLKSDIIKLSNDGGETGLKFEFKDFPYFGIWAAENANFVCLEPWCGIADSVNHNQKLSEKEGINSLSPSETFKRSWSVSLI